jgi:hypothetical protein
MTANITFREAESPIPQATCGKRRTPWSLPAMASRAIADARSAEKAAAQDRAWDLWLDCHSQREIAEIVGREYPAFADTTQQTLSNWLNKFTKIFENLSPTAWLLQLGIRKTVVNDQFTDEEAIEICRSIWGNDEPTQRRARSKPTGPAGSCCGQPAIASASSMPHQPGARILLVQIFADDAGIGDDIAVINERGHNPVRIDLEIFGLEMILALAEI